MSHCPSWSITNNLQPMTWPGSKNISYCCHSQQEMSENEQEPDSSEPVFDDEVEADGNNQDNTDQEEEVIEDKTTETDSIRDQMSVEEQETSHSSEEDEDSVVISKHDLMNLQVFRNICFNIKENLDAIKSSKKVPVV